MNKRVVISGYYGFNNMGDEAILYSMLHTLRQEMPELKITVLSQNPAATARDYGVETVNRWSLKEVAKALRQSHLLISGGGSLLQDVTGLKSLLYYLGIIKIAQIYGCPVIYYAQGIGPLQTRVGKRLVAYTTRGARAVTVRDQESKQDLRTLGLKIPLEVTADPVLGLHPDAIDQSPGAQILQRYGVTSGTGVVGVAVRQWPGPTHWQSQLAQALDMLARAGRVVVFIPMQNPADLAVSQKVALAMEEPSVLVNEKLTVQQIMSLVGSVDVLVGMRLHALIFAAVCGVPPVGIVYDPKVERFLSQLNITPAGVPQELQAAALAAQTEQFLHNRQQIRDQMVPRLKQLRQAALRNVQMVRENLY